MFSSSEANLDIGVFFAVPSICLLSKQESHVVNRISATVINLCLHCTVQTVHTQLKHNECSLMMNDALGPLFCYHG